MLFFDTVDDLCRGNTFSHLFVIIATFLGGQMEETIHDIRKQTPGSPEPNKRYLFYLHGLIIEVAGIRPKSEEHGYYEYKLILETLAGENITVISEPRPEGTEVILYAEKVVGQVSALLDKGVPPTNIAVIGASKGGIIAAYVSNKLQNREISYVFLAGLFEKCLKDENLKLYGRVLSIHDQADTLSITPQPYFERSRGQGEFKAIVTHMDLGHGLIYRPIDAWVDPLRTWLNTGDS